MIYNNNSVKGLFSSFRASAEKYGTQTTHLLCKAHLNRNVHQRLSVLRLSNLPSHDNNFKKFISRVKTTPFLPAEIIPHFLKHIISEIVKEGHTYPKLMTYFTEKFSTNFCNEVSYYTTILNYEGTYLSLSNNVAESYNAALNTFVLTVSKSTDINQILRRLRTHYLCSVREIKRQINVKM